MDVKKLSNKKARKKMKEKEEEIEFEPEEDERNPATLAKKLRQKIKELEAKSQEYLTGWQKERADSINLKKRLEEEKKEFAKFAKEDFATELMTVLDSFDSAFKNKEAWEKVDKNWRQGIEYIHSQLVNVLSNHGVSVINPLGEKFDPQRDEAVGNIQVEKEADDGKIMEVTSVGYKLHHRIIRAPKVKVGQLK